jgi:3-hydroxyacyl-[acyl-carrier-protein] dehydratase
MTKETLATELDVNGIMEKLPHRYPMLMIDKIINIVPGTSATGIKNVTINESIFQGHFPGHPIFPGVLIIEAMAQTAAAMVVHTLGAEAENKLVYFMTIDEARFRKPVVPGDQMHINVVAIRSRGVVWKFEGKATVNGDLHAEAIFSAMIVDKK